MATAEALRLLDCFGNLDDLHEQVMDKGAHTGHVDAIELEDQITTRLADTIEAGRMTRVANSERVLRDAIDARGLRHDHYHDLEIKLMNGVNSFGNEDRYLEELGPDNFHECRQVLLTRIKKQK